VQTQIARSATTGLLDEGIDQDHSMNWTYPQGVLRTYWGESECQAIASEAAAPGVHTATDSVRTASRNACTPSEGHRTRWKSDDSKPMRWKRLNRCNDLGERHRTRSFAVRDRRADSTRDRGSNRVWKRQRLRAADGAQTGTASAPGWLWREHRSKRLRNSPGTRQLRCLRGTAISHRCTDFR